MQYFQKNIREIRERISTKELKSLIEELYWEKKLTIHQIAKTINYSYTRTWRFMVNFNIRRRTRSQAHKLSYEKGMIPWNKGLKDTHFSPKTEFKKGVHYSPETEFKKGIIPKSRKLFLSKREFEHMYTELEFSTIAIAKKLQVAPITVRRWLKKYHIPIRSRPEARKVAILQGRAEINPPTKPELQFINICKQHDLPFYYVGDGSFWLGHPPVNPDFIESNGRKIAIEIFGDYWHNPELREVPRNQTEEGRREVFQNMGWELIVIWAHEIETGKIPEKLMYPY